MKHSAGSEFDAYIPCGDKVNMEKSWNERLHAQGICIDAKQKMIHRCVGRHGHAVNAAFGYSRTTAQQIDQRQDCFFNNGLLKPVNSTGLLLLNNTVNYIRTIANLSVSGAGLGENLSGFHIYQEAGNR